ncbi:hypothetical protein J6590_059233 [Homalodisca vitripennis]|nr:hypothetical protein J6590_059233 [Homalodisca vitripennis]
MSLVPIGDGVSVEVEGDKTGDEAAIVTPGDNVADTKDDNEVPSGDKARDIATGGEAVAVETDIETVDVGVEDKLLGVLAGDEHCDDRRLMVTGCRPVCLPPLTITDLMSGSVFREAPQFLSRQRQVFFLAATLSYRESRGSSGRPTIAGLIFDPISTPTEAWLNSECVVDIIDPLYVVDEIATAYDAYGEFGSS